MKQNSIGKSGGREDMGVALTLGSLFDGSGGFPLAGSMCGIEPIWASEVEPYPIAVTCTQFPLMEHLGSVTDIDGAKVEPVDIITFGSPCQDLSVAGKRAGLKHEANGDEETTRSGLFMEAVRIIREMREATNGRYPAFALWENVPGAFSSNKGEDFRTVLEELVKIVEPSAVMPPVPENGWPYADCYYGDGWSLAYRVFDAQYWGVPQRRRRIHLVLHLTGRCAGQVLFEREGLRGHFAEGRTPWQGDACDAQDCTGADDREGEMGERRNDPGSNGNGGGMTRSSGACGQVAACLYAAYGTKWNGNGGAYSGENFILEQHKNRDGVGLDAQGVTDSHVLDDQGGSQISVRSDGKSPTLRAEMHGNVPMVMETIPVHDKATRYQGGGPTRNGDGAGNGLGVGKPGDPVPTLSTCDRHMVAYSVGNGQLNQISMSETCNTLDCRNGELNGDLCGTLQAKPNGGFSYNCIHPVIVKTPVRYTVRRLTPTECARLQGFPDEWGHPRSMESITDSDYKFWLEVRKRHAAINGKTVKDFTEEQIMNWYNKLHTDSSEYKMWGNGIALPCALYVMEGIVEASEE